MAYVKISNLNFAQPLTGNEIIPVVQNGTSYKVSVSAVGGTGDTENINGCNNTINAGTIYSSIVGGFNNALSGNCSGILGGNGNIVDGVGSIVVGGQNNTACGNCSFVGGGCGNYVHLSGGTISGGRGNTLSSAYGFIGSGINHVIKSGKIGQFMGGDLISPSIIVGGRCNKIYSPDSFIGNGSVNLICGSGTSNNIGKGYLNFITNGSGNFIVGGSLNTICGNGAYLNSSFNNFIGTGTANKIIGCGNNASVYNAILAGRDNEIGPETDPGGGEKIINSVIAGGRFNKIKSFGSTTTGFIGGGNGNSLSGTGFIGNTLSSCLSGINNGIIAGFGINIYGCQGFIGSGFCNTICADYSSIITGCCNTAMHDNSHIIGSNITSVSGNMLHANTLYLSAAALPIADPGVPGVVWNDSGTLKISL